VSGDALVAVLGVDVWCGITWEEWQVQAVERLEAAAQQAVEQEEVSIGLKVLGTAEGGQQCKSCRCHLCPGEGLYVYGYVPGTKGLRTLV
jgi:hypothetical protein